MMADKPKIKFAFFDMEGTIFRKAVGKEYVKGKTAPSLWTKIAQHLGPKGTKQLQLLLR